MIALAAEPDSLKYLASWLVLLPAEAPRQAKNCTHHFPLELQKFNTLNRFMFLKIIVQFSVEIPKFTSIERSLSKEKLIS